MRVVLTSVSVSVKVLVSTTTIVEVEKMAGRMLVALAVSETVSVSDIIRVTLVDIKEVIVAVVSTSADCVSTVVVVDERVTVWTPKQPQADI